MKTHELKILPEHYKDVLSGKKKAEIRHNDRKFQVGDRVVLKEWNGGFTGEWCDYVISHILDDKTYLQDDYVMLSLEPIPF